MGGDGTLVVNKSKGEGRSAALLVRVHYIFQLETELPEISIVWEQPTYLHNSSGRVHSAGDLIVAFYEQIMTCILLRETHISWEGDIDFSCFRDECISREDEIIISAS